MGKGIASGYTPPAEITVCDGCFHKDVCGDKDYLTENACSAKAGGCYCRECVNYEAQSPRHGYCYHWDYEAGMSPNSVEKDGFCSYGKPREARDDG